MNNADHRASTAIAPGSGKPFDGSVSVSTPAPAGEWSRARWCTVISVLFVLQIALLALFGAHSRTSRNLPASQTSFRLLATPLDENTLFQHFFAGDPTLFALANWHGFSGEAWLRRPSQNYPLSESDEPPNWLSNNADDLATPVNPENGSPEASFALADRPLPQIEPPPYFLANDTIRTQSMIRIEGDLAGRQRKLPAFVKSWPQAELLTNSVVQIAANESGEVISARLVSRCGYAEADREALAIARSLRFRANAQGKASGWANLIFEWQTVSPAIANTPNTASIKP